MNRNEWPTDDAIAQFKAILAKHAEHQAGIDDGRDTRLRGLVEAIQQSAWNAAIEEAARSAEDCASLARVAECIRGLERE